MNVFFSAHSDFTQTSDFIEKVKAQNIVLVHGNKKQTEKLKIAIVDKYKGVFNFKIFNPQNCQKLEFCLKAQRSSYIVGNLSNSIADYVQNTLNSITPIYQTIMSNIPQLAEDKSEKNDIEMDKSEQVNTGNATALKTEENLSIVDIDENFYEFSGVIAESENMILDNNDVELFSQLKLNKMKQKLLNVGLFTKAISTIGESQGGKRIEKQELKNFTTENALEVF